jgi:hypothetical protein
MSNPPGYRVSDLTQAERAWLRDQVGVARTMVERYTGLRGWKGTDLASLDRAYAAWAKDSVETRAHANAVVHACGVVVGELVASETGMRWVVYEDADGASLALHSREHETTMFPANSVAKRMSAGSVGFLAELRSLLTQGAVEARERRKRDR